MGPADTDTDTDIFSQPIFLPIPIQIYLHQHIGHRYRYRYFHFDRYLTDNWYFGRYMPIFWPISMYFNRYLADTDITDIQSSRYRYRYGRYRYPVCRYRYIGIGIGQIYIGIPNNMLVEKETKVFLFQENLNLNLVILSQFRSNQIHGLLNILSEYFLGILFVCSNYHHYE